MKKAQEAKNVQTEVPDIVAEQEPAGCGCETEDCGCEANAAPEAAAIDAIIRKRVYGAIALGFVPMPLVDLAGLTAIQVELLHALCKAHSIPFKEQWAKSAVSSLLTSGVTVLAVPALSSLLKVIPVVGLPMAAATISASSAATTYALGKVFDRHFRNGGNLGNFESDRYKAYFNEKMEEGKKLFKKAKPEEKPSAESTAEV